MIEKLAIKKIYRNKLEKIESLILLLKSLGFKKRFKVEFTIDDRIALDPSLSKLDLFFKNYDREKKIAPKVSINDLVNFYNEILYNKKYYMLVISIKEIKLYSIRK